MKLRIVVAVSAVFSFSAQADELWRLGEGRGTPTQYSMAGVANHSIEFSVAALVAKPGTLELALPDGVSQFVLTDAASRPDGVLWQGHLANHPEHQLQLTQHKGMLAGLMSVQGAIYEIIPVDVGQSALVRIQHNLYPACGGVEVPESASKQAAEGDAAKATEGVVNPAFRDRPGDIDVLIVYTPAARIAAGGVTQMETTAQAAVDNSNASFANSNMITRFNLVGAREIDYTEAANGNGALVWLRDSPVAQAWRNELLADMTSLIVDTTGGCGVGYLLTSLNPGFDTHAVQVTWRNCAVGNLTYAHEHGHNMGMQHNPEDAGSGSVIAPDAYGHWDNSAPSAVEHFRTVLSYNCPTGVSCARRMYFSNPDVSYMGRPTGIVGARNNARIGNHVADLVANFRVKTIMRNGFD